MNRMFKTIDMTNQLLVIRVNYESNWDSAFIGHIKFERRKALKACGRYFLSNFSSSPKDNPSKTMKNGFYFI